MVDNPPLDLDEVIKGLCGSDSLPDEPLLSPLREKLQTIYAKLEGEKFRDPLLKEISARRAVQGSINGLLLAKLAIVLSTDWNSLPGSAVFNYLATNFPRDAATIGETIRRALGESSIRMSDALLTQEQNITYDVASPRRTDTLIEFLKTTVPLKRAEEERGYKTADEAAREAHLGEIGFAEQDMLRVNALWSLPPGRILTEKEQRAKEAENARKVVTERYRSRWTGDPKDFSRHLIEHAEQFEAEIEEEINSRLVTYIRRDEVRIYMLEWKWHFDERVADRMYKLLQIMAKFETGPTLLAPDALLFREIQRDLGPAYPKDLKNPAEGFIDLVCAYVAMDELRQNMAEPIASMDDYHRSMEIG
ncbi:MAG: hypothetical protein IT567_04030, partial [Alphaproteobacteria bacterium]|nr:hypothetical protein [Alphaproteobacteria bacterium]